jgi:hypothetical protein
MKVKVNEYDLEIILKMLLDCGYFILGNEDGSFNLYKDGLVIRTYEFRMGKYGYDVLDMTEGKKWPRKWQAKGY